MKRRRVPLLDREQLLSAVCSSFTMLTPQAQYGNPVMLITYFGALVTTVYCIAELIQQQVSPFDIYVTLWLWITVLFANFAQALAESRGKAQAESLRQSKADLFAKLVRVDGIQSVPMASLQKGDVVVCDAGDTIPADGEVIEGCATVDESAITGESAPVVRESGGDRSAVTAGTKVISDRLSIQVTSEPGNSFVDKIIGLIEGAKRQKTPNEIALNIVLSGLTIVFLLTVVSLKFFSDFSSVCLLYTSPSPRD